MRGRQHRFQQRDALRDEARRSRFSRGAPVDAPHRTRSAVRTRCIQCQSPASQRSRAGGEAVCTRTRAVSMSGSLCVSSRARGRGPAVAVGLLCALSLRRSAKVERRDGDCRAVLRLACRFPGRACVRGPNFIHSYFIPSAVLASSDPRSFVCSAVGAALEILAHRSQIRVRSLNDKRTD